MTSGIYLAGEHPHVTMVKGVPTSVKVRVFNRLTSALVEETTSGQDGTWRVDGLDADSLHDVVFSHDGYRDIIVSAVRPIDENAVTFALTIDKTKVSGSLTDFPLYVDLSLMPAEFWETVKDGGGDIRCFLDAERTQQLPREVVSCDVSTETGELHILLDALDDDADKIIYIKVNGESEDYVVDADFGAQAVWVDYVGVYHLGWSLNNSASSSHNATAYNSPSAVTSPVGKALSFNGTNQYLSLGQIQNFTNYTVSAFFNVTNDSSGSNSFYRHIIAKGSTFSKNTAFAIVYFPATTPLRRNITNFVNNSEGASLTSYGSVIKNNWYSIHANVDSINSISNTYLNGTKSSDNRGARLTTGASNSHDVVIGRYSTSGGAQDGYFIGYIGEVRISDKFFGDNRIATEYNNQSSPATFFKSIEVI